MINFIMENLQGVLMGVAALGSGIYALTGFRREASEDGEFKIRYQSGRMKRNLAVGAVSVALMASVAFVPHGYTGVIYDLNGGIVSEELGEGLNFVVPFKQHVTNVNTQVSLYVHNNENVWQHTLDTQEIRVPIAVNWRIKPDAAAFALQNIQGDPATTIIEPAVLRSLRALVGQYALEDVAPNQNVINDSIQAQITPQADSFGIEITYVAIQDTIAKSGILLAIEEEKIAERAKLTAQHNRDIAETNANAAIETARGTAESISLVAKAREEEITRLGLTPTEYVWFTKWDGILPSTLLGDSGELIVDLPDAPKKGD